MEAGGGVPSTRYQPCDPLAAYEGTALSLTGRETLRFNCESSCCNMLLQRPFAYCLRYTKQRVCILASQVPILQRGPSALITYPNAQNGPTGGSMNTSSNRTTAASIKLLI